MGRYEKLYIILSICIFVSILAGCGTTTNIIDDTKSNEIEEIVAPTIEPKFDDTPKIVMPHDADYYEGTEKLPREVVEELEELGFTNIKTIEVENGFFYFEVESVEIFENSTDKKGSFKEGDAFPADALVEVRYYGGGLLFLDDTSIVMPHDEDYYKGSGKLSRKVVAELEDLGFTNIKTIEVEKGLYHFAVESVKIFEDSTDKYGSFKEGYAFPADALVEVHYYGSGPMEDGMIQETNIQVIEAALKSVNEYNWRNEYSLLQSEINKEWISNCWNNEFNTDTKYYELHAHEDLEIEFASFKTTDFDYDYLLFCASLFDTSLIDATEVQIWMQEFNIEDGVVEKTFGDAIFTMRYHEYDDGECFIELSIWACGDINAN